MLRGSVVLGIGLIVVELISKEPKTTGHAESTYIRQGPLSLNPAMEVLVRL